MSCAYRDKETNLLHFKAKKIEDCENCKENRMGCQQREVLYRKTLTLEEKIKLKKDKEKEERALMIFASIVLFILFGLFMYFIGWDIVRFFGMMIAFPIDAFLGTNLMGSPFSSSHDPSPLDFLCAFAGVIIVIGMILSLFRR